VKEQDENVMKIYINKKGFTLIEVLIGIVILEILIITTTTILFQVNKINRKTSTTYESIKIAQRYMEEIKNRNIKINGEHYSLKELAELTHKNTNDLLTLDSSYNMKLRVTSIHQGNHISSSNFYLVTISYKDENNKTNMLENYINPLEESYHEYLEIPISEKDFIQ
jgi:prepilin-type N-terminal cleavage/methylation domain-containing protein